MKSSGVNDFFADEFNDNYGEQGIANKTLLKVEQVHEKMGYREGLDAGKEITMQKGFDSGLFQAISKFKEVGKRIGALMAIKDISKKEGRSGDKDIDLMLVKLQSCGNLKAVSDSTRNFRSEELKFTDKVNELLAEADALIKEKSAS